MDVWAILEDHDIFNFAKLTLLGNEEQLFGYCVWLAYTGQVFDDEVAFIKYISSPEGLKTFETGSFVFNLLPPSGSEMPQIKEIPSPLPLPVILSRSSSVVDFSDEEFHTPPLSPKVKTSGPRFDFWDVAEEVFHETGAHLNFSELERIQEVCSRFLLKEETVRSVIRCFATQPGRLVLTSNLELLELNQLQVLVESTRSLPVVDKLVEVAPVGLFSKPLPPMPVPSTVASKARDRKKKRDFAYIHGLSQVAPPPKALKPKLSLTQVVAAFTPSELKEYKAIREFKDLKPTLRCSQVTFERALVEANVSFRQAVAALLRDPKLLGLLRAGRAEISNSPMGIQRLRRVFRTIDWTP